MLAKSFKTVVLGAGLSALAVLAAGCGSQASTLCSLECDCEHCNDYEADVRCRSLETQQEIADTYECADQWSAWATCVEERGRCDEEEANFTTSAAGSCSGTEPIGASCATDNDCGGFGASCAAGMCVQRVCEGDGNSCQNDSDCPGDNVCRDQQIALGECIDKASAHGGAGFDFD